MARVMPVIFMTKLIVDIGNECAVLVERCKLYGCFEVSFLYKAGHMLLLFMDQSCSISVYFTEIYFLPFLTEVLKLTAWISSK